MNYITLAEFLEDIEGVFDATIQYEEFTHISTKNGNVMLISENTYDALIEIVARKENGKES